MIVAIFVDRSQNKIQKTNFHDKMSKWNGQTQWKQFMRQKVYLPIRGKNSQNSNDKSIVAKHESLRTNFHKQKRNKFGVQRELKFQ